MPPNRLDERHGPWSVPAGVAEPVEVVLHDSEYTRVVRRRTGSRWIICKEPRGPDAAQRLRHEQAILERLAGVEGVPRLVREVQPPGIIAFEDTAASALAEAPPAAGIELIQLALRMARIVAGVHRSGVVHKDISPANVVVSPQRDPMLIDFHVATTLAEDRPGFTAPAEIAGTLEYVAPEQTGRTGRRVDQRSDLYALGATLYELATGRPPFGHGDPFQLIHDHLARVPTPPHAIAAVSRGLSEIIMRLLEKDPDRRYQSADGLAYDLALLAEREAGGDPRPFTLGEHDFPLRLAAPSRLVGREAEIRRLAGSFSAARRGAARGVFVGGAPGVGKSALVDDLRPLVTAAGGWLVKGKFDQHRRDRTADGVWQAMRALGRLLLAEPEERLAEQRAALHAALGPNAGILAGLLPEFGRLLELDPAEAAAPVNAYDRRLQLAGVDAIRSIASMGRPLVVVLDDLQWAGLTPLGFIDELLCDPRDITGLLVVGAYREVDVGVTHPLTTMISRWQRLDPAPVFLPLRNLSPADLTRFLHEMLRLPPAAATELAAAIGDRTRGNPYDTVEFINALRRDGALVQRDTGWSWDGESLRRYLGFGDVVALLRTRIDALPRPSAELLEVMACLGGDVQLSLLEAAIGEPRATLEASLAAPLEDGLLTMAGDAEASVRFRHDRVQQAAYGRLGPDRRQGVQLAIARRLADVDEFAPVAAEQYLAAVPVVTDPDERLRMASLFRRAASAVRPVNAHMAERLLATGIRLLDGLDTTAEPGLRLALLVRHHLVLYDLGRHDDIDTVFTLIEASTSDPLELARSVFVQVSSLCDRGREPEGIELGLRLLRRLGLDAPDGEVPAPTDEQRHALRAWVERVDLADELARPPVSDPRVLAIARVIGALSTPAFYTRPRLLAWLILASQRLWAEHGPAASLTATMGFTPAVTVPLWQDFRTGYLAVRHALAVSEARGYEPAASYDRNCLALFASHWFEPLENGIGQAQLAREGLLKSRHMQSACYSYNTTLGSLFECAPSLDDLDEHIEAATALADASRNTHSQACCVVYRQLLRALRGQTAAPGVFTDDTFDDERHLGGQGGHAVAARIYHLNRAVLAAIFDDEAALDRHTAAAMPLVRRQSGYRTALGHALRAMSLARGARGPAATRTQRAAALVEIDQSLRWLAARAADAPDNYGHLLRLVQAERAWTVGDATAALAGFDAALGQLDGRQRPWHRALIAERAAAHARERGLEHLARDLLTQARDGYAAWGASGKVEQLDRAYPRLRPYPARPSGTSRVRSDAIDLMAVLETSQALSSERSLGRLRSRVVETLSGLTGATRVQVAIWDGEWTLPGDGGALTLDEAADRRAVPISAFRYAERTREALLVDDATRDPRFAGDPYFAAYEHCSLLVVPIIVRGEPQAMLLLENRLGRGAFAADRLDAVRLIAGQLSVSFENARIYESLERLVEERTADLERLSRTDTLTGLANRRGLEEVLDAALAVSRRSGTPTGIMMIDIDHFKPYNDRYGHVAGDACLRRVAGALQDSIRGTDVIARYGGEEFAILLPGTDLAEVFEIAERARTAVAALREPHADSPLGHVTVSIGIAAEPTRAWTTPERMLEAADAQLYEAKRRGRNQVRPAGQTVTGVYMPTHRPESTDRLCDGPLDPLAVRWGIAYRFRNAQACR